MKDRTHDISLIDYHVKDVETFGKVLNKAAAAAFPRSGPCRYCDVYVLLLSWEDDDLGVVGRLMISKQCSVISTATESEDGKYPVLHLTTRCHTALCRRCEISNPVTSCSSRTMEVMAS